MSTTFGIKKEDEYIKVAFRTSSIRGSRWLNPLATLLPDDTKLKALDNSQQGINTIGDFKKHLLDD